MKRIVLSLLLGGGVLTAVAADALWMRDVRISPKGDRIAFGYKGDIYTVPVAGGEARRLTTLPSYESNPVWSPDGSKIAFASDRNGNFDVFVMNSDGGPAKRLTFRSPSIRQARFPKHFPLMGKMCISRLRYRTLRSRQCSLRDV